MTRSAYRIVRGGWCEAARRFASPNQDDRPEGIGIELLVIHCISLPPGEYGGNAIGDLFANRLDHDAHPYFAQLRGLRVSSHFLVRRDGALDQFVDCERRAWHAGASCFEGRERCNDFSIGIELEGVDTAGFETRQYATLAALTRALWKRYPLRAVRGHSEIAPERKGDPGPFFDWPRYLRLGRLPSSAR